MTEVTMVTKCRGLQLAAVLMTLVTATTQTTVHIDEQTQRVSLYRNRLECNITMHETPWNMTGVYCPRVWDNVVCWTDTPAGTVARQPCPPYINNFKDDETASRVCLDNGTWLSHPDYNVTFITGWTDFSACQDLSRIFPADDPPGLDVANVMMEVYMRFTDLRKVMFTHAEGGGEHHFSKKHVRGFRLMYNTGYALSLVSLLLASAIMLGFRKLHCARNTVHLNLFASFILRAAINLIRDNLFVGGIGFPGDVTYDSNGTLYFAEGQLSSYFAYAFFKYLAIILLPKLPAPTAAAGVKVTHFGCLFRKLNLRHWECRLFYTLFQYVLMASYIWIFMEAVYLHMLIFVSVFTDKARVVWYILIGWSIPLPFAVTWAITRSVLDNTLCWNTSTNSFGLTWIMKVPVMMSVLMNFLFFINILRVLFTKLNSCPCPEAKRHRYRRLARSTLVLIPVFGVYYILVLIPMEKVGKTASFVMLFIEMFFNSYQGLIVAVLLCYTNSEVRSEIKKAWKRRHLGRRGFAAHNTQLSNNFFSRSIQTLRGRRKSPDGYTGEMAKRNSHTNRKSNTSVTDLDESVIPFCNNVRTYSMTLNGKMLCIENDGQYAETQGLNTAADSNVEATADAQKDSIDLDLKIKFINIECSTHDGSVSNTTSVDIETILNGTTVRETKHLNNNSEQTCRKDAGDVNDVTDCAEDCLLAK